MEHPLMEQLLKLALLYEDCIALFVLKETACRCLVERCTIEGPSSQPLVFASSYQSRSLKTHQNVVVLILRRLCTHARAAVRLTCLSPQKQITVPRGFRARP